MVPPPREVGCGQISEYKGGGAFSRVRKMPMQRNDATNKPNSAGVREEAIFFRGQLCEYNSAMEADFPREANVSVRGGDGERGQMHVFFFDRILLSYLMFNGSNVCFFCFDGKQQNDNKFDS